MSHEKVWNDEDNAQEAAIERAFARFEKKQFRAYNRWLKISGVKKPPKGQQEYSIRGSLRSNTSLELSLSRDSRNCFCTTWSMVKYTTLGLNDEFFSNLRSIETFMACCI
jgi:hypothetical protein